MSVHLQQAITALEQELEVTQLHCADLARAIETLRPLAGVVPNGNGALRNDRQTDRQSTARASTAGRRAVRSLPNETNELGDRIVAALKVRSPQKVGELAKAAKLKLEGPHLTRLLVKLADAGRIVRKGTGRGSRVMLPGRPAKEEPQRR